MDHLYLLFYCLAFPWENMRDLGISHYFQKLHIKIRGSFRLFAKDFSRGKKARAPATSFGKIFDTEFGFCSITPKKIKNLTKVST